MTTLGLVHAVGGALRRDMTFDADATDVDVHLSIAHSDLGDLDVILISPKGTRVELFTDIPAGGPILNNTTLDDEAITSIIGGTSGMELERRAYLIRKRAERANDIVAIRSAFDGQRTLPHSRQTLRRVEQFPDALRETESLQTGRSEDDRGIVVLVEDAADTGILVEIARQRLTPARTTHVDPRHDDLRRRARALRGPAHRRHRAGRDLGAVVDAADGGGVRCVRPPRGPAGGIGHDQFQMPFGIAGDRHAIVVDKSTCKLYETWNSVKVCMPVMSTVP